MRFRLAPLGLTALLAVLGCAPSDVNTTYATTIQMQRPERVLIYDFAVSPDEVHLDRGVVGEIETYAKKEPRTELERTVGHQVAKALALELAKKISAMGLPAQRAWGAPTSWGNFVVLEGQLLSIDEGNQAERIVIGLGAGRSDVEAAAQLLAATPTGLQKLEAFNTTMESGYMPGMAETMGAGAIGGHLAVAAAAGVVTHGIGEKLSADVDAEARRTADALAKQLEPYFRSHGWLAGEF